MGWVGWGVVGWDEIALDRTGSDGIEWERVGGGVVSE